MSIFKCGISIRPAYFKNYPQTSFVVIISRATGIFQMGKKKVLVILSSVDRFSLNSFTFSVSHIKQGMLFALKFLASQIWFPQRQSHSHWPKGLAKRKGWFLVCSGVLRQELQIFHMQLSNQLYCIQSYTSWLHYEAT